jgi:hypothetical protein
MIAIDKIINEMKESQCTHCYSKSATYDVTKEEVEIKGSFCDIDQIEIFARSINSGQLVWKKTYDNTNIVSGIPFTMKDPLVCRPYL